MFQSLPPEILNYLAEFVGANNIFVLARTTAYYHRTLGRALSSAMCVGQTLKRPFRETWPTLVLTDLSFANISTAGAIAPISAYVMWLNKLGGNMEISVRNINLIRDLKSNGLLTARIDLICCIDALFVANVLEELPAQTCLTYMEFGSQYRYLNGIAAALSRSLVRIEKLELFHVTFLLLDSLKFVKGLKVLILTKADMKTLLSKSFDWSINCLSLQVVFFKGLLGDHYQFAGKIAAKILGKSLRKLVFQFGYLHIRPQKEKIEIMEKVFNSVNTEQLGWSSVVKGISIIWNRSVD